MLPSSITYLASKMEEIGFNFAISPGQTNVTQFTGLGAKADYFRDSHINDAFDNVFAWAWTDNYNIDPTSQRCLLRWGK